MKFVEEVEDVMKKTLTRAIKNRADLETRLREAVGKFAIDRNYFVIVYEVSSSTDQKGEGLIDVAIRLQLMPEYQQEQ